jgi:hypothetical protein
MVAFEKDLVSKAKKNHKLLYSYVNNQKKVKDSMRCLIDENGTQITNKLEMAECLNKQFCSVFSEPCLENDFPSIEPTTDKTCTIDLENFSSKSIH